MPSACKYKNNGRFMFKRNRLLHFVKPISQENLDNRKLKIPNKFVRRYGGDLPNAITLKVPTDAEWKVELVKTSNQYWLQDGFKEFADYYSLFPGSLLVFECESSSSIFHVLIFDVMSAMEIYYPFRLINDDEEEPNHEGGFQKPDMAEKEADIEGEFQEANKEENKTNLQEDAANLEEVNIEGEFREANKKEIVLEGELREPNIEVAAANIEEEIREINLQEVNLDEDFQNQQEEKANVEVEFREPNIEVAANIEEEIRDINLEEVNLEEDFQNQLEEKANVEGEFQEANKEEEVNLEEDFQNELEEKAKVEGEFREPNIEVAANIEEEIREINLEEVNLEEDFQNQLEEKANVEGEFQAHKEEETNLEGEFREPNMEEEVYIDEKFQEPNMEKEANIEEEIREANLEEANLEKEIQEPNIEDSEDDVIIKDSSPSRKMKYKSSVPRPEFKKMIGTNLSSKFDSCAKSQASAPLTGDESVRIMQEKSEKLIAINLTSKFDGCAKSQTSAPASTPAPSTENESVRMQQQKSPLPCSANHTPQFEAGRGDRDVSSEKQRLSGVLKKRTKLLTSEEKANALDRAKNAFKSTNPFFLVVMQPSYINMGNNLNIPYNFVKTYFKEKGGDVILRSSDGRTWTVKYRVRISEKQSTAGILGSCWKGFAVDNNLGVGDVCGFELIKGNEISLQVVIFRASEYENFSLSPSADASGAEQEEPVKRTVAECESDSDGDRKGDSKTYGPDDENVTGDLQLPESDSKTELVDMSGANEVEPDKSLVAESKSKYDANRTGDGKISSPESEIITGDLQLPESDSKTDYDENKNGELQLLESDSKTEPERSRKYELDNSIDEPVDRGFEAESNFSSPYPFFKAVVRSCYSENCTMPVPFSFIESRFKDKVQMIKLQVADGLWPVKLTIYSSFKIGCFSGGWVAFAEENSLQAGDVCAFELVKSDLLKVTIFRNGS